MTDRELLELAAKAAEIDVIGLMGDDGLTLFNGKQWNPLADDGDALRLAVRLKLFVDCGYCVATEAESIHGKWHGGGEHPEAGVSHDECDPFAATRRAIVRAAAEIGRAMK